MKGEFVIFNIGLLIFLVFSGVVWAEPEIYTRDFVEISPEYYRVILENETVRVLEYILPVGAEEPLHVHPRSGVIFYLEDALFIILGPDGTEKRIEVMKGETFWREPTVHAMKNIGMNDLVAKVVEIKEKKIE